MNPDWEKWATRGKHAGKIFVRDGVICSDSWQQARSKKIFLLKEAWWGKDDKKADWWENDDCWDLSKLFRRWKKPKHKMWWLVGIWGGMLDKRAKGEELAGLDPNYSKDPAVTQGLFSSAVVNLKKSDGKKSSDPKDLQEYVEQDWDLLLSQIVDLKPDVVLCGSTWRFVKPLLKKDEDPKRVCDRVWKSHGILWIDFWHPANRFSNIMNYHTLRSLLLSSDQFVQNSK